MKFTPEFQAALDMIRASAKRTPPDAELSARVDKALAEGAAEIQRRWRASGSRLLLQEVEKDDFQKDWDEHMQGDVHQ